MVQSAASIRTTKRWNFQPVNGASAALARELSMPLPVASILLQRGVSNAKEAHEFLHPSLDRMHSPNLMQGVDCAVERLRLAIARTEKIEIHGDYDVDGTTSTIILKTAIQMAGGSADYFIPHRIRDGYGLRTEAVDRAAVAGVKLIISVDNGIRAHAAAVRAAEVGIDMIVTDHHLPESTLPCALAVVNPNQHGCSYPEKELCGAAVAFKLSHALLKTLGWAPAKLEKVLGSLLKLVAIATVADIVPLIGENRIMVTHGLRGLCDVRNLGLRALLTAAGVKPGAAPTVRQVGFGIGPRINAAGRMDTASDVIELFLTADPVRAEAIAESLNLLNSERQLEEKRVLGLILAECEQMDTSVGAFVFCGEGWHRGVLGIVASRIVDRFHRPTLVLGLEDGEASGSGRSISAFHMLEALESMRHLFVKFGGHRQAAGATLTGANVAEFRRAFTAYAQAHLSVEELQPSQRIDSLVALPELDDELGKALGQLEPFGMGNPAPVFAVLDVEIPYDALLMKEKHLKFTARQNGREVRFKAFNFVERSSELARGARVDLAFTMEPDDYSGGWAYIVKDVRPAA